MKPAIPVIEPEDYRQQVVMKWIVLTVLGSAVFLNSLLGPFVFEDQRLDPDIHSLGLSNKAWLSPHRIANWTLAVNYAIHQDRPLGYHLANVLLHTLSGLVLFGLTCRTLLRQTDRPRLQEVAPWVAFVVALLWMIHPLQTQSVTYVMGRAELVAGLCFLLTVYGTLRGAERPDESMAFFWYGLAVVACALGMGEASYVAAAPVLVFVFDRVYLSDSFAEALRRRWALYIGFAACWALLALPMLGTWTIAAGRDAQSYVLTQPGAILHYLHLTGWPRGLSFDYSDWPTTTAMADALVPGAVVIGLLAVSFFSLACCPKVGFPAVFFSLTLLPSSIIPEPALVNEQRMHLPLAGLSVVAVLIVLALSQRVAANAAVPEAVGLLIGLPVLAILGYLTFQRNKLYDSPASLWQNTVETRPANTVANAELARIRLKEAFALFQSGEFAKAVQTFRSILDAAHIPEDVRDAARRNLALAEGMTGDVESAARTLILAWNTDAERAAALFTLGALLNNKKDYRGAEIALREAVRLQSDKAANHFELAISLKQQGKEKEAEAAKQAGLKIDPNFLKSKQ